MRNYELVIVLDGKATAAKKKTVTEKLEKLVKGVKAMPGGRQGTLGKAKDWGTKDLAYQIEKSTTGAYLIFPVELDGSGAKEVGSKLRLENEVIRYLLIRK
jgi:small subunit ribosomal protein S6